jgi:hypothetical protein
MKTAESMAQKVVKGMEEVDPSKGKEYEKGINRFKGLIRGWMLKGNDKTLTERIDGVLKKAMPNSGVKLPSLKE